MTISYKKSNPLFRYAWLAQILLLLFLAANAHAETIQGTYKAGFSPNGQALEILLECIEQADSSILIAAYAFTSKPIATALLQAHKRGVDVKLIADFKASCSRYSAVTFLANQGVPVRTNNQYAIMHHKFMVIDDKHVQTGSFNYSAAAVNKNAENVLLLLNMPELAALYSQEWQALWDEGMEMKPAY